MGNSPSEFRNSQSIVVIGMGYVGIPCAALMADVDGFKVTGVQRRSERSGWKIDCLNAGKCPFEGNEPGLAELLYRVAVQKKTFRVTDDFAVCRAADVILIDVQTPTGEDHVPYYESLRQASEQVGRGSGGAGERGSRGAGSGGAKEQRSRGAREQGGRGEFTYAPQITDNR